MALPGGSVISDEASLRKILAFIRESKGLDLSSYRQNFIYRRLRLRMLSTKVQGHQEYIALLEKGAEEYSLFLDALSINVTEFFRDHEVFDTFRKTALSELISRKRASDYKSLRAWSSACATGEEAYSLAILLKEALKGSNDLLVRIWASDIDNGALETARKAEYNASELKKIDKELIRKYFTPAALSAYQVNSEIQQMVKFHQHNIFHYPAFKGLDIIFCRNIMIYLSREQMKELFKQFHQLLNPQGYLVLGKVETLWERNLFAPVDLKAKIYQKIG